ncbi:crossover junction endodeoxyribonuclease RuvC [Maritalea porphyrae]|uniref:Crossover junction endodeoxyribonuclease RuvC n=1 Tax=Maritalea porphyrae TaxID=880732 RepID=A0ABQ5UNJ5_9HYPH|nr:crossover junction endodeoxyribonuclease RuvC [Maritalea porphyrae]GLQ16232.1 crossover junction endodeoxyribonuclease RuvC [Maritalea porphyrae]
MSSSTIRILGIDPGLRNTGWGIIDQIGNRLTYVASGVVQPPIKDDLPVRLLGLHEGIKELIAKHKPDEAAVEETFVNAGPRSALLLGQARGVCLMTPSACGLRVGEYSANKVKKSVVGAGHADKNQVQLMINILLPTAKFESADAADALAIAITHAHHRGSLNQKASA